MNDWKWYLDKTFDADGKIYQPSSLQAIKRSCAYSAAPFVIEFMSLGFPPFLDSLMQTRQRLMDGGARASQVHAHETFAFLPEGRPAV